VIEQLIAVLRDYVDSKRPTSLVVKDGNRHDVTLVRSEVIHSDKSKLTSYNHVATPDPRRALSDLVESSLYTRLSDFARHCDSLDRSVFVVTENHALGLREDSPQDGTSALRLMPHRDRLRLDGASEMGHQEFLDLLEDLEPCLADKMVLKSIKSLRASKTMEWTGSGDDASSLSVAVKFATDATSTVAIPREVELGIRATYEDCHTPLPVVLRVKLRPGKDGVAPRFHVAWHNKAEWERNASIQLAGALTGAVLGTPNIVAYQE